MPIHHTAIIDPKAMLDSSVSVGPYSVIGPGVEIDQESEIGAHCVISGPTTIGKRNIIGPFATIGAPPQDLKYKGEPTRLVVGDDNIIREYVSLHRGTPSGRALTEVGSKNLLMAYVHIAHDSFIGDGVVLANAVTLAGHVSIHDRAIIGGLTAIQQFTRIGAYSYIGGMSGISKDIPPFVVMSGIRGRMRLSGINKVGLKRAGFSSESIKNLSGAFKLIFRDPGLLLADALEKASETCPDCQAVAQLVGFFSDSHHGVLRKTTEDDDE